MVWNSQGNIKGPPGEGGGGSSPTPSDRWMARHSAGLRPGRYYDGNLRVTMGAVAITSGVMFLQPFYASDGVTADRIGINITTAVAATNVRLAIYQADSLGLPLTLLVDSGDLSSATTGGKEVTISQALTAGQLYWTAAMASASGVSATGWSSGNNGYNFGFSSLTSTQVDQSFQKTFSYAAYPSTLTGLTDAIGAGISVRLRIA